MIVRGLQERDYEKYEEFLLQFEETLLYYSIKYKLFLEELLSVESNYLLVVDESDNIQAILPLMKKKGKFGVVVNSLPYYGSNGGIVSSNDQAYALLLDYYYALTKDIAGSTYIANPLDKDKKELEYDVLDRRIGQWTPIEYIENIEESIMLSYHSKTRNLVRKAMKLNIEVKVDNTKIDFLYETHYENITSIGGKAKSRAFFELLDKHFKQGKEYNLYVALLDGKIIGAVLLFYYNKTVEYFTPAVISEYRSYQPTSLIIYKAMVEASKNGYRWWNWGGTWLTQDGVYHFKKRFGAIDKEYRYYTKINNKEIYQSTPTELLKEYDNFYVIPFEQLKK